MVDQALVSQASSPMDTLSPAIRRSDRLPPVSGALYAVAVWSRLARCLFLLSLGLLPLGWWPPFPWLHERAQWSDLAFCVAAIAWVVSLVQQRRWPRWHPSHLAIAGYLGWAMLAFFFADPAASPDGLKLLGLAELATLAIVTTDVASCPDGTRSIALVTALTSLLTAGAALSGAALFYAGTETPLLGYPGDLLPGHYPRVRAGFFHPNLLASYLLFAAGITASERARLPLWLRRMTAAALTITVVLTFSRTILSFGFAAFYRNARTPSARRIAIALGLATAVIFVTLTFLNLRLDPTRPFDLSIDPAPSPRRQAAVSTLATITQHPLFGVGPGLSPGRAEGVPFDAHCTPLNVAGGIGLPALFFFLAIPTLLWSRRSRTMDRALGSALLALGLDSLVTDVEDFRHLWLLFGLLASEHRVENSA